MHNICQAKKKDPIFFFSKSRYKDGAGVFGAMVFK